MTVLNIAERVRETAVLIVLINIIATYHNYWCCQDAPSEAANLATFTKDKLEDHQHQMNWERGQIDYLGVDSFDNIIRKIETVISQKDEPAEAAEVAGVVPSLGEVPPVLPRPPPVDLDHEHEEMIMRRNPRKREVFTKEQVDECKRSPSKKGAGGFKPKPKPMRGRGQQDRRERYMRQARARNEQHVADADLHALPSRPEKSQEES